MGIIGGHSRTGRWAWRSFTYWTAHAVGSWYRPKGRQGQYNWRWAREL